MNTQKYHVLFHILCDRFNTCHIDCKFDAFLNPVVNTLYRYQMSFNVIKAHTGFHQT